MHPILSNRHRLRAFAITWAPVGLLVSVLPYWWVGGSLDQSWPVIAWGEALALPALASWYVCRFTPIADDSSRVIWRVGAAALLTSGVWLGAGELWFWAMSFAADTPDALFARFAPLSLGAGVVAFVVMSAVHYALAASDDGRVALCRAFEADVSAREAELRALRAQVDPHFLFNCLHSISALVGRDPVAARRMCLELAEFFRASLRAGSQARVPLGVEAALLRQYFDIERVRFGDRLRVTFLVSPDAEQALVPPLLLQPLAENAVRHGIATLVDGGDVAIDITRHGDRVQVIVTNPYDPDGRRGGTGVGLANVRARLEASYCGRATLRVQATGARFSAEISLPVEDTA